MFAEFLREYSAGRTPNPDVLCNAEIKFKAFLDHALGAGRRATSRPATMRACGETGGALRAAARPRRGQGPELLPAPAEPGAARADALSARRTARRREVREIAREIGLPNAAKKDSTGICFIGERPFREFLNRYLPTQPGPIRDDAGRVDRRARRPGVLHAGPAQGHRHRRHERERRRRRAVVRRAQGHREQHAVRGAGARSSVAAVRPRARRSARAGSPARRRPKARAWLRRRDIARRDAGCVVTRADADSLELHFDEPQWAVTPGQSAVLYHGEASLGGGVIASTAVPRLQTETVT